MAQRENRYLMGGAKTDAVPMIDSSRLGFGVQGNSGFRAMAEQDQS